MDHWRVWGGSFGKREEGLLLMLGGFGGLALMLWLVCYQECLVYLWKYPKYKQTKTLEGGNMMSQMMCPSPSQLQSHQPSSRHQVTHHITVLATRFWILQFHTSLLEIPSLQINDGIIHRSLFCTHHMRTMFMYQLDSSRRDNSHSIIASPRL